MLRWALKGYGVAAIAVKVRLKPSTVETHLRHIDRKVPGNRPRVQKFALWAAGCPEIYLSIPD